MTGQNLAATEFTFLSELLMRESSIVLGPDKEYLVNARLLPLARKSGVTSVGDFLTHVRQRGDRGTVQAIIDAMTTNETSWFRDSEPFGALTESVLPTLLSSRGSNRHLRVWSAACSSGQETYSLAMTLQEFLPAGWSYEILATDISADMVARAEAGQYSQIEMNRGLPAKMLVHYFERHGAAWRVAPTLRRNISFQRLNLAASLPAMAPFDLVFLRNVLIYFDIATKRTVLGNVGRLMRPDAYLFLGAAESTIGVDDRFRRQPAGRTFAYQFDRSGPVGGSK